MSAERILSEIRWYRGLIRPKLYSLGRFYMHRGSRSPLLDRR